MRSVNVVLGGVYLVRVSGNMVPVRILNASGKGYTGVNLKTQRLIHTRTAARLRRPLTANQVAVYTMLKA